MFTPDICLISAAQLMDSLGVFISTSPLKLTSLSSIGSEEKFSFTSSGEELLIIRNVIIDIRARSERFETGMFADSVVFGLDEKDVTIESILSKYSNEHDTGIYYRYCLLSSGLDRVFCMVDPARAKRENEREMERIKYATNAFFEKKVNLVCFIAGGFAECLRECVVRKVEPNLIDCGDGVIRSACIAYSLLNYDDVPSLDNFISSYVKGFEENSNSQDGGANVLSTPSWMGSMSLKENEYKEESRLLLSPIEQTQTFSIDDM